MRDTKLSRRFGTVRFVYRSGMGRATKRKKMEKERGRGKENGTVSQSKCMRTRDNANARRALFPSFSLFSFRVFLSFSFSFSLLSTLTCWCGLEPRLEVNSRVHLRSTRWIIQRTLTVLCTAEETARTQRVNRFRKMKHHPFVPGRFPQRCGKRCFLPWHCELGEILFAVWSRESHLQTVIEGDRDTIYIGGIVTECYVTECYEFHRLYIERRAENIFSDILSENMGYHISYTLYVIQKIS